MELTLWEIELFITGITIGVILTGLIMGAILLISKISNKPQITIPKKGETFIPKPPYNETGYWTVKILDVKENIVHYYMGPVSPNEKMELKLFLSIYKLKEK